MRVYDLLSPQAQAAIDRNKAIAAKPVRPVRFQLQDMRRSTRNINEYWTKAISTLGGK